MQVGKPAPVFTAPVALPSDTSSSPITDISLTDYAGKWLCLVWYPLDFTTVCLSEIVAMSDRSDEFSALGCELLGASTDSVYTHRAWMNTPRENHGIAGQRFPLLADMTHSISRDYGVLIEEKGYALRGLFLIDPKGIVQYAVVHGVSIGRSVDETLRTLQALQSGGFCAANWKPGEKNL